MQINEPFKSRARGWRRAGGARSALLGALLGGLLVLHACGGGIDSGGTGSPQPSTLAVGPISGFGSIVVGGVHYDESQATIVDGDGRVLPASALTLGAMTSIDASPVATVGTRLEAKAQTIRLTEAVVGPIESVDTTGLTLRVLGQTVSVVPGTVIDAALGSGLAALRTGVLVAVHGQIDTVARRVVATRIGPAGTIDRYLVRGVVNSVDRSALRLTVGALTVNLADVGTLPSSLQAGALVRLKLRTAAVQNVWPATELRVEGSALPDRSNVEIEGRVSALQSARLFSVDGVAVDATNATFSGGAVALGARVEVKGSSAAGVITARKVSVDTEEGGGREAIELEGRITSLDTAARTFVVQTVLVSYAGSPVFEGGTAADLVLNMKVAVKGQLAPDRSRVLASSIHLER